MQQQIKTLDFGVKFLAKQVHLKRLKTKSPTKYVTKSREYGKWTRETMTELGPTFVKLGQVLSTRNDLLSEEFIDEIRGLQDDVEPVPWSALEDVVVDMSTLDEVSPRVFKSASIGQIHLARLKNGNRVVLKFIRPNIRERMESDLVTFNAFFSLVSTFAVSSEFKMLEESVKRMQQECDYARECKDAKEFYDLMKPLDYVVVPRVSERLSSEKVIVMEYIHGVKITDVKKLDALGVDRKNLCRNLIRSYIHQVMKCGYFHADPHPGNISVMHDGRIVFYDFGLMIRIDTELRSVLTELIVHMNNRSTKAIVELLVRSGLIIPTTNLEHVEQFFDILMNYFSTANMDTLYADMANSDIRKETNGDVPFRLPIEVMYVIKTFVTIEGICTSLDPDFNYSKYLEGLAGEFVIENVDVGSLTTNILQMPVQLESISQRLYYNEKTRSVMMSRIKKANRHMKQNQFVLVLALLSQSLFEAGYTEYGAFASVVAFYFIFA